ncbi:MAG: serine/threonine protein kinase [Acidobacteria bacterium]|nr:serine/threonine protein kinase [Acidobacteriota bacterium]
MSNSATKNYYDDLIGKEINGYLIEKKLGEGGMGAVFKATKIADNSLIALKVISPMLLVNSRFVKRFQREAKVGKALAHPNIIQVLEYGETENGLLFMAMEFVNGETLKAELIKEGKLSINRISEILRQLCEAMDSAHKRGILHRDLKPENIMIAKDPSGKEILKLADFGLVKLTQPDGEITKGAALTEVGEIFGTPHFMSPEQIMGQPVGASADIYSLGVMLYQMMTGKIPLEGTDVRNLLVTKISQDIPPPSKKFSFVSQAYDNLFKTVLARDPEDRYKSAGEFYQAFQKITDMIEKGLIPESITPPNPSVIEKDAKSNLEQKSSTTPSTQPKDVAIAPEKQNNKIMIPIVIGAIVLIAIVLVVFLVK